MIPIPAQYSGKEYKEKTDGRIKPTTKTEEKWETVFNKGGLYSDKINYKGKQTRVIGRTCRHTSKIKLKQLTPPNMLTDHIQIFTDEDFTADEVCETDQGMKGSHIEVKNGANLSIPMSCSLRSEDKIECNRVKITLAPIAEKQPEPKQEKQILPTTTITPVVVLVTATIAIILAKALYRKRKTKPVQIERRRKKTQSSEE